MKRFFITLILAGATFLSVQSGNVPLHGQLGGPGPMKEIQEHPVEAYQNANGVEITFLENLGALEIVVEDESGAKVFQTTVNATAGGTLIINTGGWSKGNYTLIITDEEGGCLKGNFAIKK